MQNHNVIKRNPVESKDINDTINNLNNLLDSLGVNIVYHFWSEQEETLVDIPLQCYIIPTDPTTIDTIITGNNIDLFITQEKFTVALELSDTTFRLPSTKDTFTINEKEYKVSNKLSVNANVIINANISELLVFISGINQTDIKQNISLR